mmetsp:Transcript_34243/g.102545  ORF Transcript_34243/g.102545 Transcript_34243/m.102545 type:complete len:211 (-) Transcript_34243:399-1031(-)
MSGRRGRSMRRHVNTSCSAGRPSRRLKLPEVIPADEKRSECSTDRGKKSMDSLGSSSRAAVAKRTVSPRVRVTDPAAWRPILPVWRTRGSGCPGAPRWTVSVCTSPPLGPVGAVSTEKEAGGTGSSTRGSGFFSSATASSAAPSSAACSTLAGWTTTFSSSTTMSTVSSPSSSSSAPLSSSASTFAPSASSSSAMDRPPNPFLRTSETAS